MTMHNFPWLAKCSDILFLRVEVVEIQIWIEFKLVWQIIKRFEKEKEFLTAIWQWAETQLEAELGPASRSLSSPFLQSRTAHETA
jgi:hypothetical protein